MLPLGLGLEARSGLPWLPTDLSSGSALWLRPEDLPNRNKMYWTEDFSMGNPPWTNSYNIITGGHTDPTGGNSAWLLSPTESFHNISQKLIPTIVGEDDVISCWFKRGPDYGGSGQTRYRLTHEGDSYSQATFNVDPAWTRVELTRTAGGGATTVSIMYLPDSSGNAQSIYMWHPQCEFGTSASAYKRNDATPGGLLELWVDSSGNGRDLTQSTQANMPWIASNVLDGYSGALFDGVDDFIDGSAFTPVAQPYEIWMVVRNDGAGLVSFLDRISAQNIVKFQQDSGNAEVRLHAGTLFSGSDTAAQSTPFLARGVYNGASSMIYINNVEDETGNAGANTINSVTLGSSLGGLSQWLEGAIVETVIAPDPSATDVAALNTYFRNKFPSLGI